MPIERSDSPSSKAKDSVVTLLIRGTVPATYRVGRQTGSAVEYVPHGSPFGFQVDRLSREVVEQIVEWPRDEEPVAG